VPATVFDATYRQNPDPWDSAGAAENANCVVAIAAQPRDHFNSAFEIGCSIGVVTRLLAVRCDRVLAVDLVEAPLVRARQLCAYLPHVSFARIQIRQDWPAGEFDLIVISEVLYYLDPNDIRRTAKACWNSLARDGLVLIVNCLQPTGCPCSGDDAVKIFHAVLAGRCSMITQSRTELHRTDLLRVTAIGTSRLASR
jgi:SAM-dependent methyltransferase